jgi:hypothetical protein
MNDRQLKDKMFILSAVTLELFGVAKELDDYLDNYSMMHFYDMCSSIVDEMLEGDEYQKYLSNNHHFSENHNTCFDWYYMSKSKSLFNDERIKKVAGI